VIAVDAAGAGCSPAAAGCAPVGAGWSSAAARPVPQPSSAKAAQVPVMMLFFRLFIRKVLEITVSLERTHDHDGPSFASKRRTTCLAPTIHCHEPDGCAAS